MPGNDYLIIGHICLDLSPSGDRIGGTAAYAARTAHALGVQTAVVTSAGADIDCAGALPGISVHRVPSDQTTMFENRYTPKGRRQTLHSRAGRLHPRHVPPGWRRPAVVHLAPIAGEVAPELIDCFDKSTIGLTPQGWMRSWDETGRVHAAAWSRASTCLPRASAVVLSDEDLPEPMLLTRYRRWCRILVLTMGPLGCTVFSGKQVRRVPTIAVEERDPTGAGDIFAAAFFIRLHRNRGDPWEAARFANRIASESVTEIGIESKIARIRDAWGQAEP